MSSRKAKRVNTYKKGYGSGYRAGYRKAKRKKAKKQALHMHRQLLRPTHPYRSGNSRAGLVSRPRCPRPPRLGERLSWARSSMPPLSRTQRYFETGIML